MNPYYQKLPPSVKPVLFVKSAHTLFADDSDNGTDVNSNNRSEGSSSADDRISNNEGGGNICKDSSMTTATNTGNVPALQNFMNLPTTFCAPLSPEDNKKTLSISATPSVSSQVILPSVQQPTNSKSILKTAPALQALFPNLQKQVVPANDSAVPAKDDVKELTERCQAISVDSMSAGLAGDKQEQVSAPGKKKRKRNKKKKAAVQQPVVNQSEPSVSSKQNVPFGWYKKPVVENKIKPNFLRSSTLSNISLSIKGAAKRLNSFPKPQLAQELFQISAEHNVNIELSFDQLNAKRVSPYALWLHDVQLCIDVDEESWVCEVYMNEIFIAFGFGANKCDAELAAVEAAIKNLQGSIFINCYKRIDNQNSVVYDLAIRTSQLRKLKSGKFILPVWSETRLFTKEPLAHKSARPPALDNLVIVVSKGSNNAFSTLQRSAALSKIDFEKVFSQEDDGSLRCRLLLAGVEMGSSVAESKKSAQALAAESALQLLVSQYPVIEECQSRREAIRSDTSISRQELVGKTNEEAITKRIGNDNIGNQMLKRMGWSGDGVGLGRSGAEGISEPVAIGFHQGREGLGREVVRKEKQMISFRDAARVINQYIADGGSNEIFFSSELNSEERKMIHKLARRNGLKSKSYGKGDNRYLSVFRQRTVQEMLEEARSAASQGESASTSYQLLSNNSS